MSTVRWGILGCGSIARSFATGLRSAPNAELAAVGSRSQEKADAFGAEFGAWNRYGSYRALADDSDVDAIYVATPHPMHAQDSLLCLRAGKAVLSEKPFTVNAMEAATVISFAREKHLFLMEGMWSRFFPLMATLRTLLRNGEIGEVRMVQADFGFRATFNPEARLFNPALGGGALLDVGCYCVSLASMVLGTPNRVAGLATLNDQTGVDEQAVITLAYPNGCLAMLSTAVRTNTQHEACVYGTTGRVKIHGPWWKPVKMTVWRDNKEPYEIDEPIVGNGFNYEAVEVMSCLAAGKTESEILPLDETLAIMKTLDTLRDQWGIQYPME